MTVGFVGFGHMTSEDAPSTVSYAIVTESDVVSITCNVKLISARIALRGISCPNLCKEN